MSQQFDFIDFYDSSQIYLDFLSSCAFGLLHGYQGWLGVLRTGIMGFFLAASFVISGSLWPAVIAHVTLDLVSGLILGKTLLRES